MSAIICELGYWGGGEGVRYTLPVPQKRPVRILLEYFLGTSYSFIQFVSSVQKT